MAIMNEAIVDPPLTLSSKSKDERLRCSVLMVARDCVLLRSNGPENETQATTAAVDVKKLAQGAKQGAKQGAVRQGGRAQCSRAQCGRAQCQQPRNQQPRNQQPRVTQPATTSSSRTRSQKLGAETKNNGLRPRGLAATTGDSDHTSYKTQNEPVVGPR
jgi:hypothetical protein